MDSSFGRRSRRYARRLRSRKGYVVPFLVALVLAVMIGVTHLAIAGPVRQLDEASPPAPVSAIHDRSRLISAFAAVFGSRNGALRRVGPRHEATWFTPGMLLEAPFGPVLISEGSVVSPDIDSAGKLAIVYFENRHGELVPQREFIPAVESGSSGQIYDWRVRGDLGA